jgi:DNA primase
MTLAELVTTVFDPIREKERGEVDVDCCFCDDDKMRLGINIITGVAHCFNCDFASGDRRSVINSRRLLFDKICEQLTYAATFTLEEGEEDTSVESKNKETRQETPIPDIKMPKEFEPLWKNIDEALGKRALKYLLDRGVTTAQIKEHNIGFCANGYYAYRIVVPVFYNGKLKGIVSRDFTGVSDIKYLNSKGVKTLYNLPAKSKRNSKCILLEGVFDVLAIERATIKGYDVICGLGSKLSSKQLKILRTYNTIVVWAEPDRAGVEGTIKRCKLLSGKKRTLEVVMPLIDPETDTDPGGMSVQEMRRRFRKRILYTAGVAAIMRNRIALSSPAVKKKGKSWQKKKQPIQYRW